MIRPRQYSGIGRSGICICGHPWDEHHLGVKMRDLENGEAYIPGECEFYGCNEDGGLDADGKDHCFSYRDAALPDEHN